MQSKASHAAFALQEEQKFLQQRVESLQKELEIYSERSRHELEQLKSELNSTQEVRIIETFAWRSCQAQCVAECFCCTGENCLSSLA